MRTTARNICRAFADRKTLKLKNTKTNGLAIYLFDKLIVYRQDGEVYFTLAGYNTNTTKSRLNDFFHYFDVPLSIGNVKGEPVVQVMTRWVLEHEEGTGSPVVLRYKDHPIEAHRVYKVSDFTSKGNL